DRGVYRSADAGAQWSLVGDNLPAHLDAGLLAREPQSHATMYAGFSLTSRRELLRRAIEGGGALRRLDLVNVAGGLAFFALLLLASGVVLKRLARTYFRVSPSVPRRARTASSHSVWPWTPAVTPGTRKLQSSGSHVPRATAISPRSRSRRPWPGSAGSRSDPTATCGSRRRAL